MLRRFDTVARPSGLGQSTTGFTNITATVDGVKEAAPLAVEKSFLGSTEKTGETVQPGLTQGGKFAPKVFHPWGPYRSFYLPPSWQNDAAEIAAYDRAAQDDPFAIFLGIQQNFAAFIHRGVAQRNPGDPVFLGYAEDLARPEDPSVTSLLFKQAWVVVRPPNGALDASVPSDGRVLPGGRVLFPPACGTAPSAKQAYKAAALVRSTEVRWTVEKPQVSLESSRGLIRGPLINHFADLPLAQWWFRVAHALATDVSIIEALDRTDPRTGRVPGQAEADRNPYGWEAQIYYVRAICEALAAAYNALNIPWYIDPVARSLWRDWFAGHDAQGEFDVETDTNDQLWFRAREQCGEKRQVVIRARMNAGDVTTAGSRVGQYVALTAPLWLAHNPGGESKNLEFLQRAGVTLVSANNERDPYLAPRAANRGFASSFPMWGKGLLYEKNKLIGDLVESFERMTEEQQRAVREAPDVSGIFREAMFQDDWYAQAIDATTQKRDQIVDWRVGGYDPPGLGDDHVQVAIPLRWYLSWLREWTTSVCIDPPVSLRVPANLPTMVTSRRGRILANGIPRRDVWRILDDSMSYALQLNITWASKFGGNQRFATMLADKSETLATLRPPAALQAGTQIVSLVGGTIGNALLPGLGSLIGAGVSFLGTLTGALFASVDCTSFGRDDLGRHKPVFERNYLDGDPERAEPPRMPIPIPPGFCRSTAGVPRTTPVDLPGSPIIPAEPSLPTPPPSPVPSDTSWNTTTMAVVGIGVVLAAVLSYFGYQYFSRSRRPGT